MRLRRLFAAFLSILASAASTVCVAASFAPEQRLPAAGERARIHDLVAELESLADTMATVEGVAGLGVVAVKDGQILLAKGAGVADMRTGTRVDGDTVFRVASLSKSFAAAVAAQLVSEGVLQWNMPIRPWLPGFHLSSDDDAERVTLRDLLSHRVGLPYNTMDRRLEADEPYPLLVEALPSVPMTCPVGDCYAYQNITFSLVGDLIFATTGNFYSFQVEKRLFDPLDMRTATYGRVALEAGNNWARPHIRDHGAIAALDHPKDTYYRVAPAAGINASAKDIGQWLIAQMGGHPEVLPPDMLEILHAPVVDTPHEIRGTGWRMQRLRSASYGLGWRVMDYAGERLIFHAGAVQGYRAMLGFLPERGFGFAVLWNSEVGAPAGMLPVALDRFLGLPPVDWIELDKLKFRTPPITPISLAAPPPGQ